MLKRSPWSHPMVPLAALLAGVSAGLGLGPAVQGQTEPGLEIVRGVSGGTAVDEVSSGLADFSETERAIRNQAVEQEVKNGLLDARRRLSSQPAAAKQDLKILLEALERDPNVDPDLRAQLRSQLQSAIRESYRREVDYDSQQLLREENLARQRENQRIVQAIERDKQLMLQLFDKFNLLMLEGQYEDAERQAMELAYRPPTDVRDKPTDTTAYAAVYNTMLGPIIQWDRIRRQKQFNFVHAMASVNESSIPFDEKFPVVYPAPEVWRELSARRKQYAQVDLARRNPAEQRIYDALSQELSQPFDFTEATIEEIVEQLRDEYKIPIAIDRKSLDDMPFDLTTKMTKQLSGVSLKSALRSLLKDHELTYVIKEEVLTILSSEGAGKELITKVYPVGDLVVPITSGGGLLGGGGGGGLGGGGGGGGFGGGGGGLGGGGGGFGGGGGGLGGGGGGGLFDVKDEPSLEKKPAAVAKAPDARPSNTVTGGKSAVRPIDWDRYFVEHQDAKEKERTEISQKLRKRARELMAHASNEVKFNRPESAQPALDEIAALIQSALRHGFSQPWMYEALGLSLRVRHAPDSEVERALMSGVDLGTSVEDLQSIGNYLAGLGLHKRALQLFQQVAVIDPTRPDAYVAGLAAASKIEDLAGIQWACLGILRQAWPKEQQAIETRARREAQVVLSQLESQQRTDEASEFAKQLRDTQRRDCQVAIRWTGDADIDIMVEEPGGTVCSYRMLRTTAGGVLLGDNSARPNGQASLDGYSEVYVCPEAFSGEYRLILRRIWGKVTAGKVTVDITKHMGTDQEERIHRQIDMDEQCMVLFDVQDGRRSEPLADAQIQNIVDRHLAATRDAVARQVGFRPTADSQDSLLNYLLASQQAGRSGRLPLRRGAVGYRPVITTLPEGTGMFATAVISADRRYVRVTPSPQFTGIGDVSTFNFVTGSQTTQQNNNNNSGNR